MGAIGLMGACKSVPMESMQRAYPGRLSMCVSEISDEGKGRVGDD